MNMALTKIMVPWKQRVHGCELKVGTDRSDTQLCAATFERQQRYQTVVPNTGPAGGNTKHPAAGTQVLR